MKELLWHFALRLVCITQKLSASLLLACLLLVLPTAHAAETTILVFGDSLSAAYGIAQADSWVTLLEQRLAKKSPSKKYKLVNASISGETTSGGLSRIVGTLKQHQPKIVIVELGANDGLQGLPVKQMQSNLRGIIQACLKSKSRVLLVGMNIPPNYGAIYQAGFKATYPDLAKEFKVNLVPFLLEGVAGKPELNQEDGIHPIAKAQTKLLENVWQKLSTML